MKHNVFIFPAEGFWFPGNLHSLIWSHPFISKHGNPDRKVQLASLNHSALWSTNSKVFRNETWLQQFNLTSESQRWFHLNSWRTGWNRSLVQGCSRFNFSINYTSIAFQFWKPVVSHGFPHSKCWFPRCLMKSDFGTLSGLSNCAVSVLRNKAPTAPWRATPPGCREIHRPSLHFAGNSPMAPFYAWQLLVPFLSWHTWGSSLTYIIYSYCTHTHIYIYIPSGYLT